MCAFTSHLALISETEMSYICIPQYVYVYVCMCVFSDVYVCVRSLLTCFNLRNGNVIHMYSSVCVCVYVCISDVYTCMRSLLTRFNQEYGMSLSLNFLPLCMYIRVCMYIHFYFHAYIRTSTCMNISAISTFIASRHTYMSFCYIYLGILTKMYTLHYSTVGSKPLQCGLSGSSQDACCA